MKNLPYNKCLLIKLTTIYTRGKLMLKQLRNKKTAKKIWIILAILVLPAFLLWGSGSIIGDKDKTKQSASIGKVSGKLITLSEYKDALEATRNQAILQFGDSFSEIQKYINLESQAWDRILLLSEAKKRKIRASDKEVIELITGYPFLQRKNKFDNKIYQNMLKYTFRTQPRIFEEQTRQNIILSKFFEELTKDIKVTEEEIKKEYTRTNEQISVYYIAAIPFNFIDKTTPITEKELQDYFTNNALAFKQPLSYNLEYISAESEDKIQRLIGSLNNKAALSQLLKDTGLAEKETGLFPENTPIPGIGFSAQVANSISKIKVGEYLPAVQIEKTYYLFKLKERKEPNIPELEQIKDKVKEKLIRDKSETSAKMKIDACAKKLKEDPESFKTIKKQIEDNLAPENKMDANLAEFDNAAKLFGLKSSFTEPFKHGSYIESIGSSDMFWEKIISLNDNQTSDVISLPSGFYILKLKSRITIDEKKFNEEKAEFARRLSAQKKQEFFSKFIEELKKGSQRFQ